MSVPTCHRTLLLVGPDNARGLPCLGSRCSLWLPQYAEVKGDGSPEQGFNRFEPTGRGVCADNPERSWADPAADERHA